MGVDHRKGKIGEKIAEKHASADVQERLEKAMNRFAPQFLEMARAFLEVQPLYYDEAGIWWAWSFLHTSWEIVDDIDILNLVSRHNQRQDQADFPVFRKDYVLTALKMAARQAKPEILPSSWVQFRAIMFDTKTSATMPASPSHFCVNPIPWKLASSSDTPMIQALFESWVEPDFVLTLYEILAYCALADYPIHRAFCFIGTGRNGKTKYQKLIRRFVGTRNSCSGSLTDLETNRFGAFNLYKKLVCQMGETNYARLEASDMFKRLTGQDPVSFEKKGKDPINDLNYAKLLINTNGLPSSIDESEGFYRRWLILDFPNTFAEGPCPVDAIPDEEFERLARKVTELLPALLARNTFTGEGSIEERKRRYQNASNPLSQFLEEGYVRDPDGRVKYNLVFDDYKRWLTANKRRVVKRSEFKEALIQEGYDLDRQRYGESQDVTWVVTGLRERGPIEKFTPPPKRIDDGKNATLPQEEMRVVVENIVSQPAIDIRTRRDILAFLRARAPALVDFEEIVAALDPEVEDGERWLISQLIMLKRDGDVIESKPGRWTVLQ